MSPCARLRYGRHVCSILNTFARVLKGTDACRSRGYGGSMLTTIAIVLVVLWLLGMLTSTAVGGFIHILLIVAIVMVLIRVMQGRRVV